MGSAATSATRDLAEVMEVPVMAPGPKKMFLRLNLFKGTFLTQCHDKGAPVMKAAVWSRMPEELIRRVLLLLPAVHLVRLQLVSRGWRQMLTSTDFRKQLVATAAAEEHPVLACVMCDGSQVSGRSTMHMKVVEIDLSFVPSCFWISDSYIVEAAADGLVCIRNKWNKEWQYQPLQLEPEDNQYCVINPLTRTCKMLPKVPFPPWRWLLTSCQAAIATLEEPGDDVDYHSVECPWLLATYDLDQGAAGKWTVVDTGAKQSHSDCSPTLSVAACNDETYACYNALHVTSPAEGGVTLGWPEFLDLRCLPTSSVEISPDAPGGRLVAHRGSIFCIWEVAPVLPSGPDIVLGIWKLVRCSMTWEAVAGLGLEELHRLTRCRYTYTFPPDLYQGEELLSGHPADMLQLVQGAGDFLCFSLCTPYAQNLGDPVCFGKCGYLTITVGFNLETGTWELLHDQLCLVSQMPLELRPDSFLF